jgi:Acyl CoA binding protein
MEGDVEAILPRPRSSNLHDNTTSSSTVNLNSNNDDDDDDNSVEQSQLMKQREEREAKGELEKWEAWQACKGLGRTEAKRRYVEVLIQTMKIYAAGTSEARELVEELEFVWNQIRELRGIEGGGSTLRNTARAAAAAGVGDGGGSDDGNGRLRVLSPVSRGGSGEIVEGEDASMPERPPPYDQDDGNCGGGGGGDDDEADESRDSRQASEHSSHHHALDRRRRQPSAGTRDWRHQVETALTKISTEMAALREQMDELNSSSSFSLSNNRSGFGIGRRKGGRRRLLLVWMRWILWIAGRQLALDALVLGVLLVWGVWRGDDRFERWIRRRWEEVRRLVLGWKVGWEGSGKGNGNGNGNWASVVLRVVPARFL